MPGDERADRPAGGVDGDVEGGLANDGDAFTRNGVDVGVVVFILDEGDAPGGDGGEVHDVDAGALIRENGNVGSIIQFSSDSGGRAIHGRSLDRSYYPSCWSWSRWWLGFDGVDGRDFGAGNVTRPVGGAVGIYPTAGFLVARRMAIPTNCHFARILLVAHSATICHTSLAYSWLVSW